MKKAPYLTFGISGLAIVVQFFPNLAPFLEWNTEKIHHGELWRIFGGHLTHWTASHLIWDLVVFAFLGSIIERNSRSIFLSLVVATTLLSHFALTYASEFQSYRGLSAIDTAFFVQALFILVRNSVQNRSFALMALSTFGYLAIIAKLLFELGQPDPIFANNLGSNVSVATITHIAGLVSALLIQASYLLSRRH